MESYTLYEFGTMFPLKQVHGYTLAYWAYHLRERYGCRLILINDYDSSEFIMFNGTR